MNIPVSNNEIHSLDLAIDTLENLKYLLNNNSNKFLKIGNRYYDIFAVAELSEVFRTIANSGYFEIVESKKDEK